MAFTIDNTAANYASIADPGFGTNTGTIMAWIYVVADNNVYQAFWGTYSAEHNWIGTAIDGSTLRLSVQGAEVDGTDINVGQWYHMAVCTDGTSTLFYLDGVLDITGAGFTETFDVIEFGLNNFGDSCDARFAGIKMWSDKLTVAEVNAERNTYLPKRTTNLLGFYPCQFGATERLRDYSGGGNDLTNNGTLTDEDGPPLSWGGRVELLGELVVVGETVGLATETATAFALTHSIAQTVGLASEADSALAAGSEKTLTVGLTTETDSAFALTHSISRTVGLATEADSALGVLVEIAVAVGLATEADSALALTAAKALAVGLALESDSAFGVQVGAITTVGMATEADSALGLTAAKALTVGLTTETDTALATAVTRAYAMGLSTEADSALAIVGELAELRAQYGALVVIPGGHVVILRSDGGGFA